jgi:hypothetical protein
LAYCLQAFIGRYDSLRDFGGEVLSLVELPQGYGMLPLTSGARKKLGLPFCPLTDGDGDLPVELVNLYAAISSKGYLAYVEAEFFGGDGTQASAVFIDGKNAGPIIIDAHAISSALAEIGVQRFNHWDEFAALGLDKHRNTEEWLVIRG